MVFILKSYARNRIDCIISINYHWLIYMGFSMIERYITDEWQTMKKLHARYMLDDFDKCKRSIRNDIERYNQSYYNGDNEYMIVYSKTEPKRRDEETHKTILESFLTLVMRENTNELPK